MKIFLRNKNYNVVLKTNICHLIRRKTHLNGNFCKKIDHLSTFCSNDGIHLCFFLCIIKLSRIFKFVLSIFLRSSLIYDLDLNLRLPLPEPSFLAQFPAKLLPKFQSIRSQLVPTSLRASRFHVYSRQ